MLNRFYIETQLYVKVGYHRHENVHT